MRRTTVHPREDFMPIVKERATYQDLLEVPDNLVAEILDGDLYGSPRPALPHTQVASTLGGELHAPFGRGRGGPGGWRLLDEPELHFGNDVLVPDLAGWRRERLPQVPKAAWLSLAPDWVCEVASPSTEQIDRVKKLRIYAREGVAHAWLVNPTTKTLEVLRLLESSWTLVAAFGGDETVRAEPFDAIELDLRVLWGEDPEVTP
jgi:Uma2 family endonuclease